MTDVAALTVDSLSLTFRNGLRVFSRRQTTVL